MDPELTFVPFAPLHLDQIRLSPAAAEVRDQILAHSGPYTVTPGLAFTALIGGRPVAAAGIDVVWPGRGVAWGLFEPLPLRAWLQITRRCRSVLAKSLAGDLRRIEATVDAGFAAGVRWIERLGFEIEAELADYGPDGRDHFLYARLARKETRP